MHSRTQALIASREHSARLRYEAIGPEHAALLAGALCGAKVYAHISAPAPADEVALRDSFTRKAAGAPPHRGDEQWVDIAVCRRADTAWLGRVEATLHRDRVEIAYLFGVAHWDQGYALEAMEWLHARLEPLAFGGGFWATVHPANARSAKLLHRCGYRQIEAGWPDLASYDAGDLVYYQPSSPS